MTMQRDYSPEFFREVETLLDKGVSFTAIAEQFDMPRTTLQDAVRRHHRYQRPRGHPLAPTPRERKKLPPLVTPVVEELTALAYPPAPFPVVDLPTAHVWHDGTLLKVVWLSDTHVPWQDDRALALVYAILDIVQPDIVIHGGDLLDCYKLSRFDKNPWEDKALQNEVDMARQILWNLRQHAPTAQIFLLEGNHEDRLRKVLWNLPEDARAIAQLTHFQEQMTWPKVLDLEALGVQFVPTRDQTKLDLLPKMVVKHGSVVRKWSGWSAKGEHEKYGKSGVSGHSHRLGGFWHRDHNGSHVWFECGCTCLLDPDYMVDPDWQQGCLVMTFDRESGAYQMEPVFIHHGNTVFRGELLVA
jgi:transposase-like protein/predicted phosphodiesterase